MKLVEINCAFDLDEVTLPQAEEYRFLLDSGEDWTISFVPTVPFYASRDDELYGDLFDRKILAIENGTRPIMRGGNRERAILDQLGTWVDATIDPEEQNSLLYGKFPRMTQEMVWHRQLIWLRRALERRRSRVETD